MIGMRVRRRKGRDFTRPAFDGFRQMCVAKRFMVDDRITSLIWESMASRSCASGSV